MVVRINSKPIKVSEDTVGTVNWLYLGVTIVGYLLGLYVLDYAAAIFIGTHPFPFINGLLSWFF